MRTHVVLPDELVEQVDILAGKGKRSRFIEEAVREKVRRESLLATLAKTAGSIPVEDNPDWATSEQVAQWVHDLRKNSDRNIAGAEGG